MPKALAALQNVLNAVSRLPARIAASLNPETPDEARIVEAQLQFVQSSIRRLDWALPLAGLTVLLTAHAYGIALAPPAAVFAILAANCLLNEYLFTRKPAPAADIVGQIRQRAHLIAAMTLVLAVVWCGLVISMYHTEIVANRLFVVLILACTLGSLSIMVAMHTAAAVGAVSVISCSLLAVMTNNMLSGRLTLLPIGITYIVLVVNQARGIHGRFERTKRLELERETLIAELRNANRESLAAEERANAANRAKSEFLANMSHELRTPLNAIIGFSEIMEGQMFGALGHSRYREYSGLIHNAGSHLLGLINDVLDMSKIEAGKLELTPEEFDLNRVIGEIVALMNERASETRLEIVVEVPARPLVLFADRRAVSQILLNLLSNAIKFTLPGGRITIRANSNGGSMTLSVEDTGVGIPADDLPRLGQPFVQVHNQAGIPQQTGTGLGLALVAALAKQHGGSMRIESEENIGTTVTVEIPVRVAPAAASTTAVSAAAA